MKQSERLTEESQAIGQELDRLYARISELQEQQSELNARIRDARNRELGADTVEGMWSKIENARWQEEQERQQAQAEWLARQQSSDKEPVERSNVREANERLQLIEEARRRQAVA